MNEQGLLPCPFCGSPARKNSETGNNILEWVECSQCWLHTKPTPSGDDAVATWNTRTSFHPEQAASEAMIEKVWEAFHGIPNPSNDDIAGFTLEQIAQRTAELEKRVEELERILKQIHSIACLCIHKHTEYTASAWMADIENRCTAAFLFAKERISQAKED